MSAISEALVALHEAVILERGPECPYIVLAERDLIHIVYEEPPCSQVRVEVYYEYEELYNPLVVSYGNLSKIRLSINGVAAPSNKHPEKPMMESIDLKMISTEQGNND